MKDAQYEKMLGIAAGALLLLAVLSIWPYAFYQLLRWVVVIAAVVNANYAYKHKHSSWVIVLGIIAIVFNPIAPLYLTKGLWAVLDIIAGAIMFASVNVLHKRS